MCSNSPITIQNIANWSSGQIIQKQTSHQPILYLCHDTRQLIYPDVSLFMAFVGSRVDGHDYIQEAYDAGVRNFLISKPLHTPLPDANVVLVPNVRTALWNIATEYRRQFTLPIIGITGSNGKTIVKEWLAQVLMPDFSLTRTPKSFNSQIGVPISLWQIRDEHNIGIFEAGISRKGEMALLQQMINPTIGIFTNIGEAHSAGFGSIKEKVAEKMVLFQNSEVLIARADHPYVVQEAQNAGIPNIITWSTNQVPNAIPVTIKIDYHTHQTAVNLPWQEELLSFTLPFDDQVSIENAIHVIIASLYVGVNPVDIQYRLMYLRPLGMRLEVLPGIRNSILINDSYSNDLTALASALQLLKQQSNDRERVVFLSDMLQSRLSEQDSLQEMAGLLSAYEIQTVITIGTGIEAIKNFLPTSVAVLHYPNVQELLNNPPVQVIQDKAILIKGSRSAEFERLLYRLQAKGHSAVLEVNLNAIVHNLYAFSRLKTPAVRTMVMVKAAAYGSGDTEVARLLERHQVDYFGVAYTDEGVALRQNGITTPIMVLNPGLDALSDCIVFDLEPEIYSLSQIHALGAWTQQLGPVGIHLKVDTGMRRLGFENKDIETLAVTLAQYPAITVQSIFTHLAASDSSSEDEFTHLQVKRYQEFYEKLTSDWVKKPLRHVLNSNGIARFPMYHFDMVRLGIGLYGYSVPTMAHHLEPAFALKARISQVKRLAANETIGYNRAGKINHPATTATVNIGYADGLSRATSLGKYALKVRGHQAQIVGYVCMDMCMIDVSNIDHVAEGDEVIIFDRTHSVEDLARVCGTIPYDIFTSIAQRVRRVYVFE